MGVDREYNRQDGFTLIELSIVLVVIGLLVGGVLVGQDLIRAAGVRATISQIEKFNTAANTFFEKYRYLPGDIPDPTASSFGFAARGTQPGQGDGNGIIMGYYSFATPPANPHAASTGESPMVWVDLSAAHLIEGNFTAASPTTPPAAIVSGSAFNNWFPAAKLGGGNYITSSQVMALRPYFQ